MDFGDAPPAAGGALDRAQREQLIEQVKAQMAMANAQELLQVKSM